MSKQNRPLNLGAIIALIAIILVMLVTLAIFLFSQQRAPTFNPDFGSLIGGSLGGIGTLLAVIFSIKAGRVQADAIRHDNVRPLLNIWHLNGADKVDTVKGSDIYDWVCDWGNSKVEKKNVFLENMIPEEREKSFFRFITIKNIGLGTAINIKLTIELNDIKLVADQIFHLEKGATTLRRLIIPNIVNPHQIAGSYNFHFAYKDMLGKEYSQDIPLELIESAEEKCGINLASYVNTFIDGFEEV